MREMGKVVLKSFYVSNFKSFKDEISFTTEIDYSKKEYLERNTFEEKEEVYNKVSYIYGANGSGKTNFCRAIGWLKSIIALSPIIAFNGEKSLEMNLFKSHLKGKDNYFKFEAGYESIPIYFCIELLIDDILYTYSFKTLNNIIIEEKLYKKVKRRELILNRTSERYEDIELKGELLSFKPNIHIVKEKALCLSMANILNNKLAHKIIGAINKIIVINMSKFKSLNILSESEYTEEKLNKYLEIIKVADPTIKKLNVIFNENEASISVEAIHNIYKNNEVVGEIKVPFFEEQSHGTINIFELLPLVFKVLDEGGILVVDEIENVIHPNLLKAIIDKFYNKESNPLNAQLICTTHNTNLIEKDIRRDEIWLVDRDSYGQSYLNRLSDKKVRQTESYSQKYLSGIFGGVPEI